MKAAAENLASITLELGGKSPAIVTNTARIKDAAQRIAVSKFVNAGQTCVAPDYVLVDKNIAEEFVSQLIHYIKYHFADKNMFAKIVSDNHFNRLNELVSDAIDRGASVAYSEEVNPATHSFFPVVLTNVPPNSRIMEEEIFGPILPVVIFSALDEAIGVIITQPKPLGLYIFSQSNKEKKNILERTSSGGACINDCAIQFLHHALPFGGVNSSGIGKSHGHAGFLAFSNEKPVLKQSNGLTITRFLYPPYKPIAKKLLNGFLKVFHR
jgi:aldehyde dehydrogenase (NAD+)